MQGRVTSFLAVLALAAVACGSTVPQGALDQALQDPDQNFGLVPGTGSVAAPSPGLTTPGGGVPSGTSTIPGVSSPTGGPAVPSNAAVGPGITPNSIFVGILYQDSGGANQAAFGVSLEVDARKPYNAVIKEINDAGGIRGRKIKPLYYRIDAASAQTIDQQAQAACAHWTQDNKVFAIFAGTDVLRECAKRAGAIQPISGGASLPQDFETYLRYVEISGLNLIRIGPVTVTGLHRQGYFEPGAKLGIMLWDEPNYRASLDSGYLPALRKRGVELATEPAYVTAPQQFQDLGATSADVNSAVLRFQTQGITHVMILDGPAGLCAGACLGTLFLRRAEQQDYYPRYGFNANNQAAGAMESGLYPPSQLSRSVSVEWNDADEAADEGWRINKARERCFALMRRHGVPMENTNQQGFARFACEQLWFIQAVDGLLAETTLTPDTFMSGVNALGSSFRSPSAYAVHLSATQHDGIAAARNMRFVDSCECYEWTSDPYPV